MKRSTLSMAIGVLTVGLTMLAPLSIVSASGGSHTAGVPATSTVTLPLFGVQLTVDITTGPGGALTSVNVNPADSLTAVALKPNKVVFVNDAGTGKVVVRSNNSGQKVETKAGSLSDLSGDGGWSGDLFGNGTTTTVQFTIGATPDGAPDISGISTSDPTAQIGDVRRGGDDSHDGDDGNEQQASVRIVFTSAGQSRSLTIRVTIETDDNGTPTAKTSVVLSKIRGVRLPAVQVAGPHSWSGLLCDGSTATIDYVIGTDGAISDVVPAPAADVRMVGDRGVDVRFSPKERVSIGVRKGDGTLKLSVNEKIRCDSPAPAVNTKVSVPDTPVPTTSDGQHDDAPEHDGSRDGDGSHDGSRQGG
jgi:hypothetical protein